MRTIENPVLQGMQMGNELSKLQLSGFFGAMERAAQNANNAYLDNKRRLYQLQNINMGLTASGENTSQAWKENLDGIRKLASEYGLQTEKQSDYSTPSFYNNFIAKRTKAKDGTLETTLESPDYILPPRLITPPPR